MAKRALLGRLQDAEPDRLSRAHLRTFQRAYVPAEGAAVARHHGKPARNATHYAAPPVEYSVALTVGAGAEFGNIPPYGSRNRRPFPSRKGGCIQQTA